MTLLKFDKRRGRKKAKKPAKPLRKTRVKPTNPKRKAKNHARAYGGEYADYIRSLPCVLAEISKACWGVVQAHHTKNGGMSKKGPASTLVPVCHVHHRLIHSEGQPSVERVFGVDLKAKAAELFAAWSDE